MFVSGILVFLFNILAGCINLFNDGNTANTIIGALNFIAAGFTLAFLFDIS